VLIEKVTLTWVLAATLSIVQVVLVAWPSTQLAPDQELTW
jgi:hypothetical protein